ncbi:endonuclease/exonuclease/phosphatase family protein [Vibrio sinaloensis]|uniref:endonuclease/exonuclease/phosphatase family protein n=1 Tax=Photobacterium sp. (strain ATCC 43367) TaxID=379097 RepID=UPI002055B3E3|nr:endonuclease/exonuclease/phosphatase family protein [Vibrio sinaloensis]UPQ89831.1 endonuclease/exonuclease/phosphatase family protein [Vibrio sinaloensis]
MFNVKYWLLGIGFWLLLPLTALAEQKLVYSSWNLEWLSSNPSGKFPSSQRNSGDYQALSRYFNQLDSDVLAFQEVNDLDALRKVVGNGYQLYLSQRSQPQYQLHQFSDINQYTGFAVRGGIRVENKTDIQLDSHSNSKLRFASYVVIHPTSDAPIHLLSVHLKARCSGAYKNNPSCRTLSSQAKALNQWIVQRESNQQTYMIIGDFNHNLSYPDDWLWKTLSSGSQAKLATRNTPAECKVRSRKQPNKTHQFRSLIDHVVTSSDFSLNSVKQVTYKPDDLFQYQLSDHCPLLLQ